MAIQSNPYYTHLDTLIYQRGVKRTVIAKALGITTRALQNKISNRSPFTWNQVCIIQQKFFPDISKDELLYHDDKSA